MSAIEAITRVPLPVNEPVRGYAPGSTERESLKRTLTALPAEPVEVGSGGGDTYEVRSPSDHGLLLARVHQATTADAEAAVVAARAAKPGWAGLDFDERAAVFLKAAELLAEQIQLAMTEQWLGRRPPGPGLQMREVLGLLLVKDDAAGISRNERALDIALSALETAMNLVIRNYDSKGNYIGE